MYDRDFKKLFKSYYARFGKLLVENLGTDYPGDAIIEGDLSVLGSISAVGGLISGGVIAQDIAFDTDYDLVCEAGTGLFDWSLGTGIFKTTSGENTLMGNVTIDGACTFTTGTGAVTLKGAVSIDATKKLTCGPIAERQLAKTATYPILDTDPDIVVVGTLGAHATFTLPTLADNQGRTITIVIGGDPGANNVIVDGEGAEKINNATTWTNSDQYSYLKVFAGPTEWLIVGSVGTWT